MPRAGGESTKLKPPWSEVVVTSPTTVSVWSGFVRVTWTVSPFAGEPSERLRWTSSKARSTAGTYYWIGYQPQESEIDEVTAPVPLWA